METANICEEYITLLLLGRQPISTGMEASGDEDQYYLVPPATPLVEPVEDEAEEQDDDGMESETSTLPSLRPPSSLCCDQSIMYIAQEASLPASAGIDKEYHSTSFILQQLRVIATAIKLTEFIGGVYYSSVII